LREVDTNHSTNSEGEKKAGRNRIAAGDREIG
jgi:hypothetical protein